MVLDIDSIIPFLKGIREKQLERLSDMILAISKT